MTMDLPANMTLVHQPLDVTDSVEAWAREKTTTWLVQLDDPKKFIAELPPEFQQPTDKNRTAGLPPNVWCGVAVRRLTLRADIERAKKLRDVRARVLWVMTESLRVDLVLDLCKSARRCSSCGRRSLGWSKKCPTGVLCRDAKLVSEISWIIVPASWNDDSPTTLEKLQAEASEVGVKIWPHEIPAVPELEVLRAR